MMKKILVLLIPFFAGVFQAPLVIGGEIIKGKACYRFSDQESIAVARDIALAMAKREALEGYSVFVNATTTVENYTMKNNLITSITAANLNNLKITKKSENLAKREVCRAISAEVDPIEIKEQVYKRVSMPNMATGKINTNFPTGLWESKYVLSVAEQKGRAKSRVLLIVATYNHQLSTRPPLSNGDRSGIYVFCYQHSKDLPKASIRFCLWCSLS